MKKIEYHALYTVAKIAVIEMKSSLVEVSRLTQTCEVVLESCEVLFYGEKGDFLAKSTSQPPFLKQKSTSQVVKSTSQVAKSTSQVGGSTSQPHF